MKLKLIASMIGPNKSQTFSAVFPRGTLFTEGGHFSLRGGHFSLRGGHFTLVQSVLGDIWGRSALVQNVGGGAFLGDICTFVTGQVARRDQSDYGRSDSR